MSNNPISVLDVKNALKDPKFREKLPKSLDPDVQKYLQNPNCTCNIPIYQRVLQQAEKEIKEYYPEKSYISPEEELEKLSRNNFSVVNCSIGELEDILKKLKPGRKQISMSRYEDQVTVIINELDAIY